MIGAREQQASSPSLRVFDGEELVFSSGAHWLHPLLELEKFLEHVELSPARMRIEDKIIGKAAAFLIVRLGFRQVFGAHMSRLAEEVFRSLGVTYSYGELVDRIDCATESLLEHVTLVDEGYRLVKERAAGGESGVPRHQ